MSKETYPTDVKDVDENGFAATHAVKTKPWWKFGGKDYSFVSVNAGYATSATSTSTSDTKFEARENLGHNVWVNDESKEIYKPIEGYEGAHRFDPSLEWSQEEEKRLVRIVSLE